MRQRCQNPRSISYRNYGAKGVKVCSRWQIFENFLADMGERPEGLTLDRINPLGDYEPGNCRWATWREQCNNYATRNVWVTYKGEKQTLQQLSDKLGLKRCTLKGRIFKLNWPEERWAEAPRPRRS